jgi:hypothetical protein
LKVIEKALEADHTISLDEYLASLKNTSIHILTENDLQKEENFYSTYNFNKEIVGKSAPNLSQ